MFAVLIFFSMVCTHWHTMVFILFITAILIVKFLLINPYNLLGSDLQDESVVESTLLAQTQ